MSELSILLNESHFHRELEHFVGQLKNSPYNVDVSLGDIDGNYIGGMWTIKYKANKILAKTEYEEIKVNGFNADNEQIRDNTEVITEDFSMFESISDADNLEKLKNKKLSSIGCQAKGSSYNPDTNKAILINNTSDVFNFFAKLRFELSFIR